MLNGIFVFVILASILLAALTGHMQELTEAILHKSREAVELAIKLIGVMAFFLGLMKVAEAGGMLTYLARLIRPLMIRLFPQVPPDHPAMGAMILNLSANALGLGNAASTLVGQNLGARQAERAERSAWWVGAYSGGYMAVTAAALTIFARPLIAIFDPTGIGIERV